MYLAVAVALLQGIVQPPAQVAAVVLLQRAVLLPAQVAAVVLLQRVLQPLAQVAAAVPLRAAVHVNYGNQTILPVTSRYRQYL